MADKYELPEEILYSIFLLMPTKPLLRLKCLSKHWNHVISDERFMKLRSRRMIILSVVPLHAIDNNVSGKDMGYSMIKLHFPFKITEDKSIIIVGTFDGIVLLVVQNRHDYRDGDHVLILYNPFTAAFKIVPDPQDTDNAMHIYGFGFGTTQDDLKIVRINIKESADSYDIFSLKKGSWNKPLNITGKYLFVHRSGMFANGFLYWIDVHMPSIVAFDLKEMVFSEITISDGRCNQIRLGTFNKHLCMLCYKGSNGDYELKVMNEHGSIKSWSTICSSNFDLLTSFNIMHILDEGKLILFKTFPSNQRMVIYDMLKDSYREMNAVKSLGQLERLHSVEYVESSISP